MYENSNLTVLVQCNLQIRKLIAKIDNFLFFFILLFSKVYQFIFIISYYSIFL